MPPQTEDTLEAVRHDALLRDAPRNRRCFAPVAALLRSEDSACSFASVVTHPIYGFSASGIGYLLKSEEVIDRLSIERVSCGG